MDQEIFNPTNSIIPHQFVQKKLYKKYIYILTDLKKNLWFPININIEVGWVNSQLLEEFIYYY